MTPEVWRRVRQVLEEALEVPSGERRALLERHEPALRREVESLLRAHDEAASRFEEPLADLRGAGVPGDAGEPPERLGPYVLGRRLGEGGMGTVYLATRRDSFRQQVAVKLLRGVAAGGELVRRFTSERQILADLEHPNIARLIDGGVDGGRHYLVMEYVDGEPVDDYCDAQGLDLRRRLELFLDVCAAVHFAHQNLVVHRDLKPSNVLVTGEGAVKLLDFGIAKILAPESFPFTVAATRPGLLLLTPEYASPEQVNGRPITTASDVYSLGVMLYELLSGHRPYSFSEGDLAEVVSAVCHRDPERPSSRGASRQRRRELSGDLDAIVLKALRKEPRARYASAEQLAEDVRRHLAGRPVRARRSTAAYRAAKFVRRHRLGVATACSLLLLLLGFTGVVLRKNAQIERQTVRAQEAVSVMSELFSVSDPSRARGERVRARELLDQARGRLEGRFTGAPLVRADLLRVLGGTYVGLGLVSEGEALLEEALELYRRFDDGGVEMAACLHRLAYARGLRAAYAEAETAERRALEIRRRLLGEGHALTLESLAAVAHLRDRQGDYEEARRLFERSLALAEEVEAGDRRGLTLEVLRAYAGLEKQLGDVARARHLYRRALDLAEEVYGGRHPELAELLNDIADFETDHRPEKAESLLERARTLELELFEDDHTTRAATLNNLGRLRYRQGRLEEAEAALRDSLAMKERLYGEDPNEKVATSLSNLADVLARQGHLREADEVYRRAVSIFEHELGPRHWRTTAAVNGLAAVLEARGQTAEALEQRRRALEDSVAALGEDHVQVTHLRANLARLLYRTGDTPAAFEEGQRVVETQRRLVRAPGDPSRNAAFEAARLAALSDLATYAAAEQRHGAARSALLELIAARRAAAADPLEVAKLETRLAGRHLDLDEVGEARALARRAGEVLSRQLGPGDLWTLSAQSVEGRAALRQGDLEEARRLLEDRLRRLEDLGQQARPYLPKAIEALAEVYDAAGLAEESAALRRRLGT